MAYGGTLSFDDGTTVHRWDLTQETSELLLRQCRDLGLDTACEARAESRRREVLAERLLLHRMGGHDALRHNSNRAPSVAGCPHMSIAHTRRELMIAVNPRHPIGIDLEGYRRQLLNVRRGFLSEDEQAWLAGDDLRAHAVAWTAKEAVFKLISVRALVKDYRHDIALQPFAVDESATELRHSATFGGASITLITRLSSAGVFTLATTR